MDENRRYGKGRRFTNEDVLALVTVLTGEMSGRELHLALQKEEVFKKSEVYGQQECDALGNLLKKVECVLGPSTIIKSGPNRTRKYSLAITQDEALNRLTSPTKEVCHRREEKEVLPVEEKVEVKEQLSSHTKVIETIQKLDRYFNNPQSYSPKQIEELISGLSGFNYKTVIEAVIESFKEVQHQRVEEMCSKFLS